MTHAVVSILPEMVIALYVPGNNDREHKATNA